MFFGLFILLSLLIAGSQDPAECALEILLEWNQWTTEA
jgi:hypothetical protein